MDCINSTKVRELINKSVKEEIDSLRKEVKELKKLIENVDNRCMLNLEDIKVKISR